MADDESQQGNGGHLFSFGDFVFDADRRELRRNGRLIELNPQPARLLEALLRRAPEIVTRNTLQNELWGGKATVEFEQSLNTCIGQLRVALGETARQPVCIITEPKVGYRFLAHVQTHSSEMAPGKRRIGALVFGGIAIIAVFAVYMLFAQPRERGLLQASEPQTYELILKARSLRKFGDATAMSASLSQFEKALMQAPEDPAAMAGAALNLAVLAGTDGFPVGATYERASMLAARSIDLNSRAVDARLARGFIALYDRWDIEAARRDFEDARILAPNYALGYAWLAAAMAAGGETDKAVAASAKASELDPVSWYVLADRCWYLVFAKDYKTALDSCAGAVEAAPTSVWSTLGLIEAHRGFGDDEAAASLLNQIANNITLDIAGGVDTNASDPAMLSFAEAACFIADKLAGKSAGPNYQIAAFYAQCGDFAAAALWLQKAVAGGESFALFYHSDPRFDAFKASAIGAKTLIVVQKRA